MTRAALWVLLAVATLVSGCAKFPDNAVSDKFTRITFRMKVAGQINTTADDEPLSNYLYFVAIRASTDPNPDPRTNPQPIFAPNPNGFVAGQPTHFVSYDTLNPQTSFPYRLFRFARTTDPDNPIDLAVFTEVTPPIINFIRPTVDGDELRFDIFTNQLVDTEEEAQALTFLQVNFLTMNRLAQTGGSRVQDFLGNNTDVTELNSAVRVDLRTNTTINNQTAGGLEPQGDTSDPDLDIVDWSIEVRRP